jgi:hypothetical protein
MPRHYCLETKANRFSTETPPSGRCALVVIRGRSFAALERTYAKVGVLTVGAQRGPRPC